MSETKTTEEQLGEQQGWDDGTHPSGVMTHLSHRDPEAWAEQTEDYRRGYEKGWLKAR
jgi:hypothetical protein